MIFMVTFNAILKNGGVYKNISPATHSRIQNLVPNLCYGVLLFSNGPIIFMNINNNIRNER